MPRFAKFISLRALKDGLAERGQDELDAELGGLVANVENVGAWLTRLNQTLTHRPILYGGSVKPDNAAELAVNPNVDGFLIGGASLEVKSFVEIFQRGKTAVEKA